MIVKTPDTITEWTFKSYCVSEKTAIEFSNQAKLNVFQPIFVKLHLPYAIKAQETFEAKAQIFNFMNKCFPSNLHLTPSTNSALFSEIKSQRVCICPNTSHNFVFKVKAFDFDIENVAQNFTLTLNSDGKKLKHICGSNQFEIDENSSFKILDSITKSINVEAEGFLNEKVISQIVNGGDFINETLTLNIDDRSFVANSSRILMRVTSEFESDHFCCCCCCNLVKSEFLI